MLCFLNQAAGGGLFGKTRGVAATLSPAFLAFFDSDEEGDESESEAEEQADAGAKTGAKGATSAPFGFGRSRTMAATGQVEADAVNFKAAFAGRAKQVVTNRRLVAEAASFAPDDADTEQRDNAAEPRAVVPIAAKQAKKESCYMCCGDVVEATYLVNCADACKQHRVCRRCLSKHFDADRIYATNRGDGGHISLRCARCRVHSTHALVSSVVAVGQLASYDAAAAAATPAAQSALLRDAGASAAFDFKYVAGVHKREGELYFRVAWLEADCPPGTALSSWVLLEPDVESGDEVRAFLSRWKLPSVEQLRALPLDQDFIFQHNLPLRLLQQPPAAGRGSALYTCPECPSGSFKPTSESNCRKHMGTVHCSRGNDTRCDDCNQHYSNPFTLRAHLRTDKHKANAARKQQAAARAARI